MLLLFIECFTSNQKVTELAFEMSAAAAEFCVQRQKTSGKFSKEITGSRQFVSKSPNFIAQKMFILGQKTNEGVVIKRGQGAYCKIFGA